MAKFISKENCVCGYDDEPSASGSAPGLPLGKHDRLVFSYTVPCVGLSSDHWLLWGKLNFPYGF